MAFAATFSQPQSLFSHLSTTFSATTTTTTTRRRRNPPFRVLCEAVKASNPSSDNKLEETKTQEPASAAAAEASTNSQPSTATSPPPTTGPKPKKTVYSMKKGQIVRVDKEKYLNSINYLSVGHPPYYKGLEYIYEDRGEVLDIRVFETGEYALIGWVGIPTAPAWLPTYMLIKSDKLDYERL